MAKPTQISADWLSQHGANRLANQIRTYWRDRNRLDIAVWVEEEAIGGYPIFVVRSNIRNSFR